MSGLVTPSISPTADGVYPFVAPPVPIAFRNVLAQSVGHPGTASWGPLNTPLPYTDAASLFDTFGKMTSDPNSLVTEGLEVLDKGQIGIAVRVDDATGIPAQVTLPDSAGPPGAAQLTFTAMWTGTRPNPDATRNYPGLQITLSKSALWQATMPTYRIQVSMPNAPAPEVFDNIIGWKLVAGVPTADVPTYKANVLAAINVGTASRAKSKYVTVAAAASVVVPALGTYAPTTVLGTNGTAGITTAILIGQDGAVRKGLWALRGQGCDVVFISGCYDPLAAAACSQFALSEYAIGECLLGPSGTTDDTIIGAMLSNGLKVPQLIVAQDWIGITDPVTGAPRLVSPLGAIAGLVAATSYEQSPGNQPPNGFSTILYTESSQEGGIGGPTPGTRAQNGISYITNQLPGSPGIWKMAHGQNASTTGQPSPTDGINYTRTTNFLVKALFSLCYPFVDALQSTSPTDTNVNRLYSTLLAFMTGLVEQGKIEAQNIDVVSNNTNASVAAGYRFLLIQAQYYGVMRFIVPTLQGGTTVLLSSSSASAALQAAQAA